MRRVLFVIAGLLAAGGLLLLLLPFDTSLEAPPMAGQIGLDVEVPCKAPLVDLLTSEPDGQWLNYSPDDGVSYTSKGRAGGTYCSHESAPRGMIGIGLIAAALVAGFAAIALGRRAREATAVGEAEAAATTASTADGDGEGSPAPTGG